MDEDERLRETLLELELLRTREAEQLRQTNALVSSLEALAREEKAASGIAALLRTIIGVLSCGAASIFRVSGDALVLEFPENNPGLVWKAPMLGKRSGRFVDFHDVPSLSEHLPAELRHWHSLLSVPLQVRGGPRYVLAAFAESAGAFHASDAGLFERLSAIVAQALNRKNLEERNGFLAAVIDGSPASVAIADATDSALPLVYVNEAFTDLTGFDPDDALGRNCRFLSAEPPDAPSRMAIREATESLSAGEFTILNRRKDGSEFWNFLRLFPINDAAGMVTNLVAIQTDATSRVNAEQERDEARRRLEAALGATSEGFLVLDNTGKIRFANDSFRDFFSRTPFERGAPIPGQIAVDTLGKDVANARETLAIARAGVSREVQLADGRHVLISARPVPEGGAVIAVSDITRIKVTETILRQRVAAIETAQDGIAITDASDRIIYANPSLLRLWGLQGKDKAVGRRWKHFYDAESGKRFAVQGPLQLNRFGSWRGKMERPNTGAEEIHEVSLSRIPDVGTIMIVSDITERVKGEEERLDLRKRLDRAEMQETFGQVSAGLAHDLNNLLSAIIGSASVISGSEGLSAKADEASQRIETAGYRAADLVNALLDFGQREKSAESLDLRKVVRSSIDLARAKLPADVRLTSVVDGPPIQTVASQTDVLQVVMNLLLNGIDAIGQDSGEVRISVDRPEVSAPSDHIVFGKWRPEARYAVIQIEDSGHGMDTETASKILQPYMTTKGNKGTGLGLAIVTSILKRNDGCLALETEPGKGTCFTVYWRIDARPRAAEAKTGSSEATTGLPILVIDDDPDVARGIADMLISGGYEVAETDDPQIGLETVSEDPGSWGCVVSDYDMPGMTGGELAEALGEIAPGLPTIIVSALAKRLDDPRLANANVKAVLSKPVRADILLAAVREATLGDTSRPKGREDAHSSG